MQKPRAETLKQQVRYLKKHHLDTTHLYNFNVAYIDSLNTPGFALEDYNGRINTTSHPLLQFRVFKPNGLSVGGYASCFGAAKKIGVFDSIPPVIRRYSNPALTLSRDTLMLVPLRGNYIIPEAEISKYDYIIIAFWAESLGYFSRHQLKMLESYIRQHPEMKMLLLKVNWGVLNTKESSPNVNITI